MSEQLEVPTETNEVHYVRFGFPSDSTVTSIPPEEAWGPREDLLFDGTIDIPTTVNFPLEPMNDSTYTTRTIMTKAYVDGVNAILIARGQRPLFIQWGPAFRESHREGSTSRAKRVLGVLTRSFLTNRREQ